MTDKDKAQYIDVLLALAGFGHLSFDENENQNFVKTCHEQMPQNFDKSTNIHVRANTNL